MNINNLTDPKEFSEYYYEKLKEQLNVTDLNLNKLGFVGFFIDLLGNVQYDIKQYYDNLFNESFPISARDNLNLLYHSNVYGFNPELATPSKIIGRFKINESLMVNNPVIKREVFFNNISFRINDLLFNVDSLYKVVYTKTKDDYYVINVEIQNNDQYDITPVLTSNITINAVGVLQYDKQQSRIAIPKYPYGSYYIHSVPLDDYLYELKVEVEDPETNEFEEIQMHYSKLYTINSTVSKEKHGFYSINSSNSLEITFGSGISGTYLPDVNVRLTIKTTKGAKGNINKTSIEKLGGTLIIYDYDNDDKLIQQNTISANAYIGIDIDSSVDGKDPYADDDLRDNLLKYIQTRNNLVSDTDFHNNLNSILKYSEILFKKNTISENIIYLYTIIQNKYLNPVYTLTLPILKSLLDEQLYFNNDKQYLVIPEFDISNKLYVCPFYFEYNSFFNTYDGYVFQKDVNFYPSVSPMLDISNSNLLPTDLFLNLVYNHVNDSTAIYVKTKTDFFLDETIDITVSLSCKLLNISNQFLMPEEDYFYFEYTGGVIIDPALIYIDIYITKPTGTVNHYGYQFELVQNVNKESDNLRLKTYFDGQTQYVVSVPLIEKNEYIRDTKFYSNLIQNYFKDIRLKENRMISDEVQFRFLNTYLCESKFNEHLFKQEYFNDIYLPFKLEIRLTFSKFEVVTSNLNVNNIVAKIHIALSKFLLDNTTGTRLKFYKSKLVDIAFNFEGVKAVNVKLKDTNDQEILIDGLETNEKDIFLKQIEKSLYLEYCPIFWWFDLNNIKFDTVIL